MTVLVDHEAEVVRPYELLDPADVLHIVLQSRLYERPLELEAWIDARIIGQPLKQIADRLGVTHQCVSLRARTAERLIAAALGLQPGKALPQPEVDESLVA